MISFFTCLVLLILSYFTYAKYVERVFGPTEAQTPAVRFANGIDYVFARLLVHKHVPSLRCLSRQVYQCSGARGNSSSANPSEQINTSVYAISYNAEESPAVCRRAGYYPRSADGAEEPSNSQLDHMPFRYRFTRGRCSRCGHSTCRRVVECRTLVISTERATHKGGTDGQAR